MSENEIDFSKYQARYNGAFGKFETKGQAAIVKALRDRRNAASKKSTLVLRLKP